MSDRLVRHLGENGVLTLRLNRPDKRNAIDTPMIDALLAELETADLDSTVNVVVVRGAGKDFCSGADLVELLASADRTPEENAADAARLGDFDAGHGFGDGVHGLENLDSGCGLVLILTYTIPGG